MDDEEPKHVRRVRYRGSHPRSFSEKYKEHDPQKYPEDLARVLARGDTPAGSHRSIMVEEALTFLAPKPGERAVDATLGYGGHARRILEAIVPGGQLYGFDRDPIELGRTTERLAEAGFGAGTFFPVHANFATLPSYLAQSGIGKVDLILADLGLSSMQLDDPERGFSYKRKGPLDMRMDPERGQSARAYLEQVPEDELARALMDNANEEGAEAEAHSICLRRGRIHTTRDLAEAICAAFPGLAFKDPEMAKILRRSFQAIRIEVNAEFSSLEALLAALPSCLAPGGRAVFIAFHSGEDSRVAVAFASGSAAGLYSATSAEALRPGQEERYGNPRSSSAKLRWAVRKSA